MTARLPPEALAPTPYDIIGGGRGEGSSRGGWILRNKETSP